MRTTQWGRAAEIFAELIELPIGARADRLNALSANDSALHAAVLRLLALDEGSDAGADFEAAVQQVLSAGSLTGDLQAGGMLGPYRILQPLGEGGMGQVYLAERDIGSGVQRVALKIPQHRPGRRFVERFMRERSILAGLNHPAIARLVDSGALVDGRPYFAMEYVDGLPIIEYCDRHRLGVRQRLQLFLRVLPAVQHAHENLVLHRDIKSANVFVGRDGLPRLLDFGIAKSVEALADQTLTQDEARFFSLASAAPEQITGAATSVATDIYALGVLLYELVCGLPALDLHGLAPAEALSAITDRVPATPAAAVLELLQRDAERAQQLAEARSLGNPMALSRHCGGDLGLILARALRKQPRARYASAEAFARDLQSLLELRPIAQRHGDRLYRMARFVQRHRVAMLSLAVVLAFSVAYLGLAWRQAEALAVARDRAQAGRAQAEQVTEFLVGLFRNADPNVARGTKLDAEQMLERGAAALQTELVDQPELRAKLLATLADIYLQLDQFSNARTYAEQVIDIGQAAGVRDPAIGSANLELLARVALAEAKYDEVMRCIDKALAVLAESDAERAESSVDATVHSRLPVRADSDAELRLLALRATVLSSAGEREAALRLFEPLDAEMRRRYSDQDIRTRSLDRGWYLALAAAGQTKRASALAHSVAIANPKWVFSLDPATGRQAYEQAALLRDDGDLEAAERLARQALEIATAVFGKAHAETAAAYNLLGTVAQAQKRYADAEKYFEYSLEIKRRLYDQNHPIIAAGEYNLGKLSLLDQMDAAKALPHLRSAVEIAARTLSADHPNLALFRLGLGQALRDLRDYSAARTQFASALRVFTAVPAPRGRNKASATGELACLELASAGDVAHARIELERAMVVLTREMPGHPWLKRLQACQLP